MKIIFSIGYENQVSILHHPDWKPSNDTVVDALYDEIDAGCPMFQEINIPNGVYSAEFQPGKVEEITILQRDWRDVA